MKKTLNKHRLNQLQQDLTLYRKFLPALDLKRQQLMARQKKMQAQLEALEKNYDAQVEYLISQFPWIGNLGIKISSVITVLDAALEEKKVMGVLMLVKKSGVEPSYSDFNPVLTVSSGRSTSINDSETTEKPYWLVNLYQALKPLLGSQIEIKRLNVNLDRLAIATKKATQKVNLFSKVKIPDTEKEIRNINLFLGDQEKAAVIRSKLAKSKQQLAVSA